MQLPNSLLPLTLLIIGLGLTACNNGTATTESKPASTPAQAATPATAADAISVRNPRIRATAPGQLVSGAFMTLINSSDTPFALTSASFDNAGMVEIHETTMQGDMMQMNQVDKIEIPANNSTPLKPGSYHIMLMGLKKELVAGTTESITLNFSDGTQKTVAASVGDVTE